MNWWDVDYDCWTDWRQSLCVHQRRTRRMIHKFTGDVFYKTLTQSISVEVPVQGLSYRWHGNAVEINVSATRLYLLVCSFLSFILCPFTDTHMETPIPIHRHSPNGKSPQAIEKNLTNDATVKRVQHSRSCTDTFSVAAMAAKQASFHACVMMWGSAHSIIIYI